MTQKYLYSYNTKKIKKEFFTKPDKEDMTDQSQLAGASIVEMAKRFGIDAIIARAEATQIDQTLMDKLYSHDLTQMFDNKADMLNARKKLNNLFNNIPARIRKEMFHDDVQEFVNAYTTNDYKKLEALQTVGIVSKTQLENVKEYNKRKAAEFKEQQTRLKFTEALKEKGDSLYENFKKTGDIISNNIPNDTTNNRDI